MSSSSPPPSPPPIQKPTKPVWLSTPSYNDLVTHNPTLLSLFQSCQSTRQLRQIHGHLVATGLSHRQYPISTLFEFTAISSSGDLHHALRLFGTLDPPTLFSYNTIIRALSASTFPQKAFEFFHEMLQLGIVPNKYTYPFVLKSLSSVGFDSGTGRTIHGHAVKLGLSIDPYVESSLVRFYSNCGGIDDAWKLFDRSPHRSVVCWSAMASGCVQVGRFKEALELFSKFQHEQLEPNESLLVSVLCASAHLGALERGRWVHAYIKRKNVPLSINLGTALIDMYGKCGLVEEALQVLEQMPSRNVMSWTALISGMAMNGESRRALDKFAEMVQVGIIPDSVTFIGVLNACSHGGLVDEAHKIFNDMSRVYQLTPKVEHYGCTVDLLGRAGMLKEALDLIKSMPIEPDVVIWAALLNACNLHKNLEIGEFVGRLLIKLDPLNDANYVILSNLYSRASIWGDAAEIRKIMKEKGIRKCPGCSVIEVDGVVHEFFMSDESDQRFKEVKPMLDEMGRRLRSMGYHQDTSAVLLDIDEEEKRRVLCHHSEKLAIAFGLINVDPAVPIRIVKNLRACVDCHSATKLISKAFNREIIVRDRLRFHHFKDGMCSCADYW